MLDDVFVFQLHVLPLVPCEFLFLEIEIVPGTIVVGVVDDIIVAVHVIVAVDMCGAMALKRSYPVTLVFCKAHRENMILDILSRENMSIVEKKNRLLSMEQELKNEKLCDLTVRTDCLDEESIEKILEQIFR